MCELVLPPGMDLDEAATARAMARCQKLLDEHYARAEARRRPCFKSSPSTATDPLPCGNPLPASAVVGDSFSHGTAA